MGVHDQQYKEDFFKKRTFLHISKVREFLNNIISLKDPRIENTILEVACMVADWLAVSVEKNTSPSTWANYNINIRWIFNNNQIELIYDLINHYDDWILNAE